MIGEAKRRRSTRRRLNIIVIVEQEVQ